MPLHDPNFEAVENAKKEYLYPALFMIALGFLSLIGTSWYEWQEAQMLLAEQRLWNEGEAAHHVTAKGKSRVRIVNTHSISVSYYDKTGWGRRAPLEYSTLFTHVDTQRPAEVRYDRSKPERIAFSRAIDSMPSRWALVIAVSMLGVLIIAPLFFVTAVKKLRAFRQLQAQRTHPLF